jgi:Spy/CpxP family protein refolding chaperone
VKVLTRCLSVFALAALIGVVVADEKKPDAKKPDAKKPDEKKPAPLGQFGFPDTVKLSDAQRAKLEALKAEYTPKVEELAKKTSTIMTKERQAAVAEARKKAAADGKKGPELEKAVQAALKLTEAEQAQMKEINASRQKLMAEINKKKAEVLTEEQKKQLQPKPKTEPAKDKKPEPAKDKKTEK